MSKPDDTPWIKYRPRLKQTYVITPTYETEAELDEALAKLRATGRIRIPQDEFLHILGYVGHLSNADYRNDVLLYTMRKHHTDRWYAKFDITKTGRFLSNKYDLGGIGDLERL